MVKAYDIFFEPNFILFQGGTNAFFSADHNAADVRYV